MGTKKDLRKYQKMTCPHENTILRVNHENLRKAIRNLTKQNLKLGIEKSQLALVKALNPSDKTGIAALEYAIKQRTKGRDAQRQEIAEAMVTIEHAMKMKTREFAARGGMVAMVDGESCKGIATAWRQAIANAESVGDGNAVVDLNLNVPPAPAEAVAEAIEKEREESAEPVPMREPEEREVVRERRESTDF